MTTKDKIIIGIIIFVGIVFPFVLNWIVQRSAPVKVVGNEEIWLNFWATYVAAIVGAVTLYVAFATIRVTINIQKQSNQLSFHNEFRKAIVELSSCIDINFLQQSVQDINEWKKSDLKLLLMEQCRLYKNSVECLNLLIQDSDILHNNKHEHIKRINQVIKPYRDILWEVTQYAIIKDGYLNGSYGNDSLEEIVNGINDPLKCIMNPYTNLNFKDFDKEICKQLMRQVSDIKIKEISNAFNEVYRKDGKKAYDFSFMSFSTPLKLQVE